MNNIGNKWVFTVKRNFEGSIQSYKAHTLAKSFHQTPVINFFETFGLVVKPSAIRMVLTLASLIVVICGTNCAFLNGHLQEHAYMIQPEGLFDSQHSDCE